MDLKRSWAEQLADHRSDSLIHRLAPFALTRPAFTVNDAMAEIGGTFASVNNAAARLVEKRILVIAKGEPKEPALSGARGARRLRTFPYSSGAVGRGNSPAGTTGGRGPTRAPDVPGTALPHSPRLRRAFGNKPVERLNGPTLAEAAFLIFFSPAVPSRRFTP